MKFLTHVPAAILAFLFLFGGINFFFPLAPMPTMTGNQLAFFNLFGPTGYMGVLIIMPTKRALGTLILAPISVNILLFEICLANAPGIGILLIALIGLVIYQEKQKFLALL
jgi:hypothetical protein